MTERGTKEVTKMMYLHIAETAYDATMDWVHRNFGNDHRVETAAATVLLETFTAVPLLAAFLGLPTLLMMASGCVPATTDPVTTLAVCADILLAMDAARSAIYRLCDVPEPR